MDLKEAALLFRRIMKDISPGIEEVTEQTILCFCYVSYSNISSPLKLYSFFREHVSLFACATGPGLSESDKESPLRRDLPEVELRHSFDDLQPGEVFQVHPSIIERLALLRGFPANTSFISPVAVISAKAYSEIQGWKVNEGGSENGEKTWHAEFSAYATPAIELNWDDLRIDRREFIDLVDGLKKAGPDSLDSLGRPQRAKEKQVKATIPFIAALIRLISEIARRAGEAGKGFNPEEMPGTKADFQELASRYDVDLQVADSTFSDYLKGICKFKKGATSSDFYSKLFPKKADTSQDK